MSLDITGRYRYPPPRADWLALHREPVLEPDQPIVDAHHHLWEEGGHAYLMDDLLADLDSGHRIVGTVFVQANYGYRTQGPESLRPVGETERVAAMAAAAGRPGTCAGIVAHADLRLGDGVSFVLDAHASAGGGRLRGIRHSVARDSHFPDGIVIRPAAAGLLADDAYRAGLRRLADRGLSYDAMIYHQQIPELAAAAAAIPELTIVLDHLGCPLGVGPYEGREPEVFLDWKHNMAQLARLPNVHVKLGGLGMVICGARWHEAPRPPSSSDLADRWRPYIETCITLFGADRCLFEGNFPVDKSQCDYVTLWNAFKRIARGASPTEKAALFHDTAARIYRLETAMNQKADGKRHA